MIEEAELIEIIIKGVMYSSVISIIFHFFGYGVSLVMRMLKGL